MHVTIEKICVPTDFSDIADHAVHYGAALARQHGAALHLLHVLEDAHALVHHPDFSAHGEVARAYFNRLEQTESEGAERLRSADEAKDHATHQFLKSLEQSAAEKFESTAEDWWENLQVSRVVRFGHPVEEICKYANQNCIDLIVIGTHGRSGLSKVLLGSVADRVIRLSPCPVLVSRHPDHVHTLVE